MVRFWCLVLSFCRLAWDTVRRVPLPRFLVLLLVVFAVFAPLSLYEPRIVDTLTGLDNFNFVRDSLNWNRTCHSLIKPNASHLFPPFRLWTWALVAYAGKLSALPRVLTLGSLIAIVVACFALYEFVSRETRSAWLGICSVLVAGLTTACFPPSGLYTNATSMIVWSCTFTFVTLLCVQSGREVFCWSSVIGSGLSAVLAAAWFSAGAVAGPVSSLYAWYSCSSSHTWRKRLLLACAPLAGTMLFIIFALSVAGSDLLNIVGMDGQNTLQSFRPVLGSYLALRIATEHLLLWDLGIRGQLLAEQSVVVFLALTVFSIYWFRRSSWRALSLCGLAILVCSYLLEFTFRTNAGLDGLRTGRWYVIFPQFGWAVFLVAGLRAPEPATGKTFSVRDALILIAIGCTLFLLHWPVAADPTARIRDQRQELQLRQLDLTVEVCKKWGLDRRTIDQAIGPFVISGTGFNGLTLIELPEATDRIWDPDDVRRRLNAVFDSGSIDAFADSP